LSLYSWLADEIRRNTPLGYKWGDLYADNGYFCQYAYYNVSLHRPLWTELKPGYPGSFGVGLTPGTTSPPGSNITSSCSYGLGKYAQAAMQQIVSAFGAGGPFQGGHQQTRHTFSNSVVLEQTDHSTNTSLQHRRALRQRHRFGRLQLLVPCELGQVGWQVGYEGIRHDHVWTRPCGHPSG